MLEGGCGRGQYVAYYTARGARVVGLDFAGDALAELRNRQPHLSLCIGDVGELPFREASFDLYYSGGVVEHFEKGPEAALQEAHRVLRADGVLLVSVPYLSPLRRILSYVRRRDRRFLANAGADDQNWAGRFYQYAFARQEFEGILQRCGFRVRFVQGYAILWGLAEFPGVASMLALATRTLCVTASAVPAPKQSTPGPTGGAAPSLLKRLIVSEDEHVPVVGRVIPFLRWACANMMMYVCVPDPSARTTTA
jgi:SAM-dependent methyltransferase